LGHRDTVAAPIFLGGGIHFKPVERAALDANTNLGQQRAYLAIETVLVHAEVAGRIAQSDETWRSPIDARLRRSLTLHCDRWCVIFKLKLMVHYPGTYCGSGRSGTSCHSRRIMTGPRKNGSWGIAEFSADTSPEV
jgi:hypothetical protein